MDEWVKYLKKQFDGKENILDRTTITVAELEKE